MTDVKDIITSETNDVENHIFPSNNTGINSVNDQEITPHTWTQFGNLSKSSWQTAASYTFCLEMVVLVYLLGQVNKDEDNLAAITLITGLINALICVSISPLLAMSLVAGKDLGQLKEAVAHAESEEQLLLRKERISAVLRNGLIISVPMAVVAGLPMVFSKDLLVNCFHQKAAVAQITQNFVRPYAIAVPGIMIRVATSQIMFMFGRTKPAMIIGLGSLIGGMTIGSIYAYGWLGAPKLGNDGIMIGAILNEWATALIYAGYIAWSPRLKGFDFYNFRAPLNPHLAQLHDVWTQGRTFMLSMTAETAMQLMLGSFAGLVGTQQQAAYSSIMQISTFSFLLQLAFGQSAAREMTLTMNARKFKHASQSAKLSLLALLVYTTPVMLAFIAYPDALADIQGNQNHEYRNILRNLARIALPGCYLDMIRCMFLEQMRVLGDARRSAFISSSSIFAGIALSYYLGLHTSLKLEGVATGYTLSSGFAAAILGAIWLKKSQPKAIEHTVKNPEQFPSLIQWCCAFSPKRSNTPQHSMENDLEEHSKIEMTENPIRN
ncbi:MAG: hypothetical protein CK424_07910 [Legionella sp.]|nr:MAG: hypothetical protein CK424_07910 [Legionella sp.]